MSTPSFDQELDVRGLNCPMPLVKARQTILKMQPGQVLKVLATDRGSVKDFQGWARTAKNVELVAQEEVQENGNTIFVHYVKRTS